MLIWNLNDEFEDIEIEGDEIEDDSEVFNSLLSSRDVEKRNQFLFKINFINHTNLINNAFSFIYEIVKVFREKNSHMDNINE